MFWGMRITATDLSDIESLRLAADAIAGKTIRRGGLTIAAAAVRVEGDDQFLILASYAEATGVRRPARSSDLLDRKCPAGPRPSD